MGKKDFLQLCGNNCGSNLNYHAVFIAYQQQNRTVPL